MAEDLFGVTPYPVSPLAALIQATGQGLGAYLQSRQNWLDQQWQQQQREREKQAWQQEDQLFEQNLKQAILNNQITEEQAAHIRQLYNLQDLQGKANILNMLGISASQALPTLRSQPGGEFLPPELPTFEQMFPSGWVPSEAAKLHPADFGGAAQGAQLFGIGPKQQALPLWIDKADQFSQIVGRLTTAYVNDPEGLFREYNKIADQWGAPKLDQPPTPDEVEDFKKRIDTFTGYINSMKARGVDLSSPEAQGVLNSIANSLGLPTYSAPLVPRWMQDPNGFNQTISNIAKAYANDPEGYFREYNKAADQWGFTKLDSPPAKDEIDDITKRSNALTAYINALKAAGADITSPEAQTLVSAKATSLGLDYPVITPPPKSLMDTPVADVYGKASADALIQDLTFGYIGQAPDALTFKDLETFANLGKNLRDAQQNGIDQRISILKTIQDHQLKTGETFDQMSQDPAMQPLIAAVGLTHDLVRFDQNGNPYAADDVTLGQILPDVPQQYAGVRLSQLDAIVKAQTAGLSQKPVSPQEAQDKRKADMEKELTDAWNMLMDAVNKKNPELINKMASKYNQVRGRWATAEHELVAESGWPVVDPQKLIKYATAPTPMTEYEQKMLKLRIEQGIASKQGKMSWNDVKLGAYERLKAGKADIWDKLILGISNQNDIDPVLKTAISLAQNDTKFQFAARIDDKIKIVQEYVSMLKGQKSQQPGKPSPKKPAVSDDDIAQFLKTNK